MSNTNTPKGISVFTLPANPHPSARFRERFNAVAKELGLGLEWAADLKNPLAVDPDELRIAPEAWAKYGMKSGTAQKLFHETLVEDVKKILSEVERQRLEKVKASALANVRIPYRAPLDILTPVERKAVELFQAGVKPALDRIEQRQQNPNSPGIAAYLEHHGDYHSKMIFGRTHRDQCSGIAFMGDNACSVVPYFPDLPPINGMIARDISLEEFMNLGASLPANAEALRPTTVLEKDKAGHIRVTPLPLHPSFRQDHRALAGALRKIATLKVNGEGLDKSLRDQLTAWARFFETGLAAHEKTAVQATIDAGNGGGNLRVHLGPSESYWEDNTKFPYILQVGIRDPHLTRQISSGAEVFPAVEKSLDDIPNYRARPLSLRGGFADPIRHIMIGGFAETFPIVDPAGNNFPNYDYGTEGSNRFIWLDSLETNAKLITQRDLFDDPEPAKEGEIQATVEFVVGHESGHLIGPQRNHITPNGERMGARFGKHWGSADEPKSDLTAIETMRLLHQRGRLTEKNFKVTMRAIVKRLTGPGYRGKTMFAEGKLTDHLYGNVMLVGYYFKTGALSLVPVSGKNEAERKFHIDYTKMAAAAHELWRQIITFQAAGDLEGYLASGQEAVSHIPDEADRIILENNKNRVWFFIERHL